MAMGLAEKKFFNYLSLLITESRQINKKLIATLQTSEYAKYAPGAVSGDLQSVYKDTIDLITNLEEHLNKK